MYDGDPLGALVMSSTEMDRERLRALLAGKVTLDPGQGAIRFVPGVRQRMAHPDIVLLALSAQAAIHLLEADQPDGLTPSELTLLTGIKGGSIRPALKRLSDDHVILKNEAGRYFVPAHALDHIEARIGGGE